MKDTMTKSNWGEKLESILEGIDKDECEDENGWWETSTGAKFGEKKKKELVDLLSQVEAEAREDERRQIMMEAGAVFVEWNENGKIEKIKSLSTPTKEQDA